LLGSSNEKKTFKGPKKLISPLKIAQGNIPSSVDSTSGGSGIGVGVSLYADLESESENIRIRKLAPGNRVTGSDSTSSAAYCGSRNRISPVTVRSSSSGNRISPVTVRSGSGSSSSGSGSGNLNGVINSDVVTYLSDPYVTVSNPTDSHNVEYAELTAERLKSLGIATRPQNAHQITRGHSNSNSNINSKSSPSEHRTPCKVS
jgi:hypothetical protein